MVPNATMVLNLYAINNDNMTLLIRLHLKIIFRWPLHVRPYLNVQFIYVLFNFFHRFFSRYKEWESMQAETLQYSLDEDQWEQDWASIITLASQPGTSLEQTHVFALAHILRRPVIIYGVKYVKSFRGETLGLARFQGN